MDLDHYEIHVTVESAGSDNFKRYCHDLGLKPLLIDLQTEQQIMCSRRMSVLNYNFVITECLRIMKGFTQRNLNVIRVKVETSLSNLQHTPEYYECHVPILIRDEKDRQTVKAHVESLATYGWNFHWSKNAFKSRTDGEVYFLTYRGGSEGHLNIATAMMVTALLADGIIVESKVEKEICILDTNRALDNNWLTSA